MTTESGGLQSLDGALHLLKTLARQGRAVGLSELARSADMPVSKAHRYLASFVDAGLASQASASGKYDVGPACIDLGLAAMARNDFINRTSDALPALAEDLGQTVTLSVWGPAGLTIIRWERSTSQLVTALGLGSVLPLASSASGHVLMSYAPANQFSEKLQAERAQARKLGTPFPSRDELKALKDDVRQRACAGVDSLFIPGLSAVAAPILNWQSSLEAVVTVIGRDNRIAERDGHIAQRLRLFCEAQSISVANSA